MACGDTSDTGCLLFVMCGTGNESVRLLKSGNRFMCGLAGFWSVEGAGDSPQAEAMVRGMAAEIAARGPDSAGSWCDSAHGIVLGHRRLAIQDLSAAGSQPMASPSGRYVIAFNGEVYNHRELRSELSANSSARWRGHSDTETILAGFDEWGIESTISRCVGMFAIAIWDRLAGSLHLIRTRSAAPCP